MPARAQVIIDYQNIHLTGHNLWCAPGEAKHLCLVHPLHFAQQLLIQRNLLRRRLAEQAGTPFDPAELVRVISFRGQPSNLREPTVYRRTQAQRSEWTRVAVYDTTSGQRGWIVVGGTSAASPLVAGIVGLAGNAGTLTTAGIYHHKHDFRDVVGGSAGYCDDAYICTGVRGYDGPTGLGTPRGSSAF